MPGKTIKAFHPGKTPATVSSNRIVAFENGICSGSPSSSAIHPIKGVISFSDPAVKSLCVTAWGGSINSQSVRGYLNEVTPAQARTALDAVNPFQGDTTITAFPEFQYFTGMTTLGSYRSIQHLTFAGCSSLSTVILPSSIVRLGTSFFEGTAIDSLNLKNVRFIESKAFKDCSRLKSIMIPDSVQTTGNYTFQGCSSLESIIIGRRVSYIGSYAFYTCGKLKQVEILSQVITSIGNYAFRECPSLEVLEIPDSVTTLGDGVFSYKKSPCGLRSFVIPKNVTKIGSYCFCTGSRALQWVKCLASVPPELGTNAFDTGASFPIYVPQASLNAYRANESWAVYGNRVMPIG